MGWFCLLVKLHCEHSPNLPYSKGIGIGIGEVWWKIVKGLPCRLCSMLVFKAIPKHLNRAKHNQKKGYIIRHFLLVGLLVIVVLWNKTGIQRSRMIVLMNLKSKYKPIGITHLVIRAIPWKTDIYNYQSRLYDLPAHLWAEEENIIHESWTYF